MGSERQGCGRGDGLRGDFTLGLWSPLVSVHQPGPSCSGAFVPAIPPGMSAPSFGMKGPKASPP